MCVVGGLEREGFCRCKHGRRVLQFGSMGMATQHISVKHVTGGGSCFLSEKSCPLWFRKSRTNFTTSTFPERCTMEICARQEFRFASKGIVVARGNSEKDSDGEVAERRRHWKNSSSRPNRIEDSRPLEPSRYFRQKEERVPGRDVAPVAETPGERYLRLAIGVQDGKYERKSWENEDSSNYPRKTGKKNEGTTKMVRTAEKAEETSKKEKKKKGILAPNNLNHNLPSCYGCGAILQTQESEAPGYITPQTYEVLVKAFRNIPYAPFTSSGCRLLSQGHMIPAVGGLGGYGSGKGFVLAEELRAQLSHLREKKALIVKLVDIVDFNGSFLTRVRDLVGANPIIMVLTKCDLLPEGTDLGAVGDWLQEATLRKKLNIHMTSAKAKTGISRVAADIMRERLGRDVYILGSANVGKSAFVTALLQEMAKRDPVAAAALRHKPIQSAMPGTTLGAIEFEAFSGAGKLFDTPGVHLHHRMAAVIDPEDVALLAPRRRLRGYVIGPRRDEEEALEMEPEEDAQLFEEGFLDRFFKEKLGSIKGVEDALDMDEDLDELDDGMWTEGNLSGTSLFWGGVVRIDIVKAPADLSLTFFGPSAIRIQRCPSEEADDYYEENLGSALTPPTATKVENWVGLGKVQDIIFDLEEGTSYPVGDIAISGLGWITVGRATPLDEEDTEEQGDDLDNKNSSVETRAEGEDQDDDDELSADSIELVLHTPKAVEVFVRPSIPLGKNATTWYEYEELDDAELAARPTVYY